MFAALLDVVAMVLEGESLPPPFALVPSEASTPAPRVSTPQKADTTASEVSLALARAYWAAVVSAHCLAALYYYGYAAVYSHIHASSSTDAVIDAVKTTSVERFFTPVVVVSSAVAIGHVIAVVNALLSSYRSRELVFSPDIWLDGPDKRAALAVAQPRNRDKWCVLRVLYACYTKLKKRGLYLVQVFTVVEVALQIFQGNKLSHLVASRALNRVTTAALVFNCWYLPVVHFAFRKRREKSPALEVLVQHIVNSCLDIVYGIALPAAIFAPYYYDLVDGGDAFPRAIYYQDTWAATATAESEQIFVSSWTDFVAKMVPGLALLYELREMQVLLQVSPRSVASMQRQILIKLPTVRTAVTATVEPTAGASATASATVSEVKRLPPRGRIRHTLDAALLCTGITVLALHIHAESAARPTGHEHGCLLELRPWASSSYSCAVLEISCKARALVGERHEIDAALTRVDALALRSLILSHCPLLSIPSNIQRFTELSTLKIHNATLVHWDTDAALTDTLHPKLARIYISKTNMSAIPRGLQSRDFPARVHDIHLCATNLTDLPSDLHEAWTGPGLTLGLEASDGIVAVPPTIAMLQLQRLSLAGNGIQSIPDSLLRDQVLTDLILRDNPLLSLPSSLGRLSNLTTIDIRDTNVSALPASWSSTDAAAAGLVGAPASGSIALRAARTPLCAALSPDAATAIGWFRVDCVASDDDDTSSTLFYYPLADELQWRATSS